MYDRRAAADRGDERGSATGAARIGATPAAAASAARSTGGGRRAPSGAVPGGGGGGKGSSSATPGGCSRLTSSAAAVAGRGGGGSAQPPRGSPAASGHRGRQSRVGQCLPRGVDARGVPAPAREPPLCGRDDGREPRALSRDGSRSEPSAPDAPIGGGPGGGRGVGARSAAASAGGGAPPSSSVSGAFETTTFGAAAAARPNEIGGGCVDAVRGTWKPPAMLRKKYDSSAPSERATGVLVVAGRRGDVSVLAPTEPCCASSRNQCVSSGLLCAFRVEPSRGEGGRVDMENCAVVPAAAENCAAAPASLEDENCVTPTDGATTRGRRCDSSVASP